MAPEIPPTGFDSSFLEAIRSVSELSGSLAEDGTDVGVAFLPPSTCKGAIRVSSQKRAVLRIGNKACPLLVFIGNETPAGVVEEQTGGLSGHEASARCQSLLV